MNTEPSNYRSYSELNSTGPFRPGIDELWFEMCGFSSIVKFSQTCAIDHVITFVEVNGTSVYF